MKATGAEVLKQDRLIGGKMSPGFQQSSHPTLQPVFLKPIPSPYLDLEVSHASYLLSSKLAPLYQPICMTNPEFLPQMMF